MRTSSSFTRPVVVSGGSLYLAVSRRSYIHFTYSSFNHWQLPCGASDTNVSKADLDRRTYNKTKSRTQWNYTRIDETVNMNSQFRDSSKRPDFDGPREDNSQFHKGGVHGTPKHYRLSDWFDEYSKPGSNKKIMALEALKEQWDADEFYYPGETWKKNSPAFRSVPKELVNKQTWANKEVLSKSPEIFATLRNRPFHPQWPPPGMKIPRMNAKKEFEFGIEDPALVAEVERYAWYRSWVDANCRMGPREIFIFLSTIAVMWFWMRYSRSNTLMYTKMANLWYPGRSLVRAFGEPIDPNVDCFWWQEPTHTFPNKGVVYWLGNIHTCYIDHLKERDEKELLEAQL